MIDIKWILCYYSPITNRLITLEYDELHLALKMIDTLLETYGYNVNYKLFKGEEWL